ncbi:hypothetical protein KQX54_012866 [Cotesia glomerata]|uniref:Peptidase A2 domain-containing protein n=1 Tax=Cotesia glomerata TaxID=32391 RepID=A0AAV7HWZ9_COTGL|nr:hypothetical protein KQX54_012866 [Cotesia glomerata]
MAATASRQPKRWINGPAVSTKTMATGSTIIPKSMATTIVATKKVTTSESVAATTATRTVSTESRLTRNSVQHRPFKLEKAGAAISPAETADTKILENSERKVREKNIKLYGKIHTKIKFHAEKVNGGRATFLIDTGAEINLVKDSTLGANVKINRSKRTRLQGITSEAVISLGQVQLEIEGRTTTFDVEEIIIIPKRCVHLVHVKVINAEKERYIPRCYIAPGVYLGDEVVAVNNGKACMYAYNTTDEEHIFTVPYLEIEKFEEKLNEATIYSVCEVSAERETRQKRADKILEIIPTEHLEEE